MEYSLQQRGRASIEFLVDLGLVANRLEQRADEFAGRRGLVKTDVRDPEQLQESLTPVMRESADFRAFCLVRNWQLEQHGHIAMDAFDEMPPETARSLRQLEEGPTRVCLDPDLEVPGYWAGCEFHRSAGGWDGHPFMGFVHGEIVHRKMVGDTLAGVILEQRRAVAAAALAGRPARILEMGCGSGQYTLGLAATFPDAEIWGCDLSARQLEEAQRRANAAGLRWQLFQAAAEDTGLEEGQFDLVTSYAVFHELPTAAARRVLAESLRLLRPGGLTIVADVKAYGAQSPYEIWKADYLNQVIGGDPFWREYAGGDLAARATEAGFVDAQWTGVGEHQYPFVLTARKPG